jgi:hypothetical protein
MKLYLTQHLLPDGRVREISTDVPDSLAPILKRIAKCGLTLDCEVLTSSEVVFSLSCDRYAADFDILICTNGPGTNDSLIQLIERFNEKECRKWLRQQKNADDGCGVGWGT